MSFYMSFLQGEKGERGERVSALHVIYLNTRLADVKLS